MRRFFLTFTTIIFHVLISWNLQAQDPVISSSLLVNGTVGVGIPDYIITASNLPTSFDASNLPAGLNFNPTTATISGIPLAAGNFNANISATNAFGTDTKTLVFMIAPGSQQIVGLAANDFKTYGDVAYLPGATASSGLAVSYASSNASVAAILNNSIVIVGQGTAIITASQAGNADYNPAADITQTLIVDKKILTVSQTGIASKMYDGMPTSGLVTVGTISGLVNNETLAVTATGLYADANAGIAKIASVTYVLSDGANGGMASNYSLPGEMLTGTIVPRILGITGTTIDTKVYDGSLTTGAITSGTVNGLASSETLIVTAAGLYADANAGMGKSATVVYTFTDGTNGGMASNYSLPGEMLTGTILPRILSITGTTIDTKVYDGSLTTGAITSGTVNGLVSNETLIVTATGLYADANAGVGKSATVVYTLTDGTNGGMASNYSLPGEILTGTIVPQTLSITGTIIHDRVYDGSFATGLIVPGNLTGLVSNETLVVTANGLYADANAGVGKPATVIYILLDGTNGGKASNYSLSGEILAGTIVPQTLSITGTIINPKVYDGSLTTGQIVPGNLIGLVGNETLTITATGLYADANVGIGKTATVTYTLSDGTNGGKAANYNLPDEMLTGTIVPKTLTVSGTTISPKIYDSSANTGGIVVGSISGLAGSETIMITAIGRFADANAGTDKIAVVTYWLANGTNGGLATNYYLPNDTLKGDILPKQLIISGTTVASKVYNGSRLTGAISMGTISAFIAQETVTATASGSFTDANAGIGKTATIHYTLANGTNGGLAANYNLPDEMITVNIDQAPLNIKVLVDTVKCSADSITFDKTNYIVSGLVQNEKIGSLILSPSGSPANDPAGVGVHEHFIGANSPVGVDTTSPTVFIPANYKITVDSGKLVINKTPRIVMRTDTICSNASFVVSPVNGNGNDFGAGTTYTWAAPSGIGFAGGAAAKGQSSISGVLSNISENTTVTATYRVVPVTGKCIGDTFTVLIVVRHLPSKPQIVKTPAILQLCQNTSQNFSASIAKSYSTTSSVNDILFTWTTDANLIATSSALQPKGKNAIIQFPGVGPYHIKIIDSVLERNGCANDTTITIGPLGAGGTTPNTIIYNGIDFVCLNNNVNPGIDGYQWGYDNKDLLSNNYTTVDAPFVTAQNLTRPISDTSTRYVWVLTRSGSCFTKSYFNAPRGRSGAIQPIPTPFGSTIKIYPNPVSNRAIITWRYTYATDAVVITITDITGRRISTKPLLSNITPGRAVINLAGLPGGLYLVNIRLNNKPAAVGKFVKE